MKKLKLLTRALALLLSLLMVVSIVACANDEETEETDDVSVTVDTAEGDEKLELPDVNYGGAPFTILGRSGSNSEYMKDLDISELTAESDSVDKAVYQRNRTVEEAYGVEIILIAEEETKLNSTVMNSVSSGDDTYDLIATQGRYVFQLIVGNNASEIHDFEYIDLEKSWWLDNLEDVWTTPGGKLFAINGDISYLSVGSTNGIYFNKTVLNNAKITLPYEYVRNDTWYFSTFKQMIIDADSSVDGDGSGIIGQDTFAYVTEKYRGPGMVINSTGIETLVRGGDGTYSIGIKTQTVYDAADEYSLMLNQPYSYMAELNEMRKAFGKGKAIFIEDTVKCAPTFKSEGVNFGLVPGYKYDENVESIEVKIGSGTNTFMIPITVPEEDREMVGVVVEAMAYYGQKIIIPVYYDKVLSYQSMQSPDDLEMLQRIHDAACVALAEYLNPGNIMGTLNTAIDSNTSYSTVVAGLGKAVLLQLDSWYALDNQ